MFKEKKDNLINFIYKKQRTSCDYDMYRINPESRSPSFCDCKYGWDGKNFGEQNGCPEFRLLYKLLNKMTDEEYNNILSR